MEKKSSLGFCMFLVLNTTFNIFAQSGDNNPIVFDQFFQNYYLVNPASHDSTGKFQVALGNRSLIGLFEGVNRLYVDADVRIGSRITQQYSRLGLLIIAYNDGAFINRTRAYGRYSWTTAVGARSAISAGIALGVVNYTFLSSQAGGGGSSAAFDGNAGLWYIRQKLKIGISYQQMVRAVLTPVNQRFELVPYVNLNAMYTSHLSPHVSVTTHAYFRYQSAAVYDIQLAPLFLFNEIFESGVNLRYQRGVALLFGIKSLSIGPGKIRFMGSFLLSTRKLANTFDNAFELTAGYSF